MKHLFAAAAMAVAFLAAPAIAQEHCAGCAVSKGGDGYDPGCYATVLSGQFPIVDAATGEAIGVLPYARRGSAYSSGYGFNLSGGSSGGVYQPQPYPQPQPDPPAPPSQVPSDILNGTSWQLVELNGSPINSNASLTFNPDGSGFGGNAPCNSYGGSYQAFQDFGISFGAIRATRIACQDLSEEQAYFSALGAATDFRLGREGDGLALLNQYGQVIARFERPGANPFPPAGSLLGDWRVLSAVGEIPSGGAALNENASFTFRGDGTFTSDLGCNTATGRYSVSGATFTFDAPIAVTRRACLIAAKFESALLAAFPRVRTYQIELDGSVTFRDSGGAILFTVAR